MSNLVRNKKQHISLLYAKFYLIIDDALRRHVDELSDCRIFYFVVSKSDDFFKVDVTETKDDISSDNLVFQFPDNYFNYSPVLLISWATNKLVKWYEQVRSRSTNKV